MLTELSRSVAACKRNFERRGEQVLALDVLARRALLFLQTSLLTRNTTVLSTLQEKQWKASIESALQINMPASGSDRRSLPQGQTNITSSHAHLAAVHTDLLSQRKELDDRIRGVRLLLNSTVPVNRLPLEILVRIFRTVQNGQYYISPFEAEEQLDSWLSLVSVCHAWRVIACTTPLLWRTVHVGTKRHPDFFRLFLERSAETSLDLSFTATHEMEPFLADLEKHRSRVRKFQCCMLPRSQAAVISSFLETGNMPALTNLELSFGKYRWEADCDEPVLPEEMVDDGEDDTHSDPFEYVDEGLALFRFAPRQGQFPRLERLCLRSVSLESMSALAPSLKSLRLSDTICDGVPLTRLLDFLKECKTLEHLTLNRYRFDDPSILAWIKHASHPLPHVALAPTLSSLRLEDVSPYTARFLSALSIPDTSSVSITRLAEYRDGDFEFADVDLDPAWDTLAACLPKVRTKLPLLSSVDKVHVELSSDSYDGLEDVFSGECGQTSFQVVSRGGLVNVCNSLLAIFGDAPLVELKISGITPGQLAAVDWTRLLSAFPLLRRLAVVTVAPWASDRTMLSFLEALASRQPGAAVVCSNLTDLAVAATTIDEDTKVVEPIARCLAARTTMGKRLARLRVGILNPYRMYSTGAVLGPREARYMELLRGLADTVECSGNFNWFSYTGEDFWGEPAALNEGLAEAGV
ncbi:hypothetical protein VTO73DRAFT_4955 [Trametes versicolor]